MILCGSTKDEGGLEQFTGRVFRADFPTIIDLVDDNHICKNHWRVRKNWYYERGGKIEVFKMIPDLMTGSNNFTKIEGDDDDNTASTTQDKIININNAQLNRLYAQNSIPFQSSVVSQSRGSTSVPVQPENSMKTVKLNIDYSNCGNFK
jgi:hypothetical protein